MAFKPSALAVAVGGVAGATFTICAAFVAVAPEATTAAIGYVLHLDLSGIRRPISLGSYCAGLVAVTLVAAAAAAAVAVIYNRQAEG